MATFSVDTPSKIVDAQWRHVRDHVRRRVPSGTPQSPTRNSILADNDQLTAEPIEIKEDDSSDSEDSHSDDERPKHKPKKSTFVRALHFPNWRLNSWQKDVLKCTLAYFIASLFTFVPFLSDRLSNLFHLRSPVSNTHVIATVATYFNPAKSVGQMLIADIYLIWAVGYALAVCFGSMATAVILNNADLEVLSHIVVVLFWLAGSTAVVASMKVKMGSPIFNSACSLLCLITTVVISKEGAIHLGYFRTRFIVQILVVVLIGITISNAVCLLAWKGSATFKLQGDINKTLDSFSALLTTLTSTMMNDDNFTANEDTLKKSIAAHHSSFIQLKNSLDAAKLELLEPRIQKCLSEYDKVVASMSRLALQIAAIKTSCSMQRELLVCQDDNDMPRDVFESFLAHIGPGVRNLTVASKHCLKAMRRSFLQTRAGDKTHQSKDAEAISNFRPETLANLREDLRKKLEAHQTAHVKALKKLYRKQTSHIEFQTVESGSPGLSASPNEEIFILYFFCFAIEEFALELIDLMGAFIAILEKEIQIVASKPRFTLFQIITHDVWQHKPLSKRLGALFSLKSDMPPSPFPHFDNTAVSSHKRATGLPRLSWIQRVGRQIWKVGTYLKSPRILYSIKVGLGITVLGAFAFFKHTRPIFIEYRGEWAMLSYCIVLSPTIGQTNFNTLFRIAGTCIGATIAVLFWHIGRGHPVFLTIASSLLTLPCYYVIVVIPKYMTSARFVLLAYNLTALYAFNTRDENNRAEIIELAWHRALSVSVGTLWAYAVGNLIFPYEARKELRKDLSEFFLNAAYLYEKIVRQYTQGISTLRAENIESTPLLHTANSSPKFESMEVDLRVRLIKLNVLLDSTRHEPRLKGPFPVTPYATILQACQRLVDQLHSLRTLSTRRDFVTTVRRDFIVPANKECNELSGNIMLYLSVLASALTFKGPLPAYLPPLGTSRQRLLEKIGDLPVVKRRAVRGNTSFLLFYTFAAQMRDLANQLDALGDVFKTLFGELGEGVLFLGEEVVNSTEEDFSDDD